MSWRYTDSESIASKVRRFSPETLANILKRIKLLSPEDQREHSNNFQDYFYDRQTFSSLGLSLGQYYRPSKETILKIQAVAYFATLRWKVFTKSRSKCSQLEGIAV